MTAVTCWVNRSRCSYRNSSARFTPPIAPGTGPSRHIDQAKGSLGHQQSLEVVGDLEAIAPAVLGHLLATPTEALSNIARHAKVTTTNVEARADQLGGVAFITSSANRGTTLTWTAPRTHQPPT